MTIADLMEKIHAMWPFQSAKAMEVWSTSYRNALGKYQGPVLQRAWDSLMDGWTKHGRPNPAEIAAFCREHRAEQKESSDGSPNMRQRFETAMREKSFIVAAWWRENADWVDRFLSQFDGPDRSFARWHLGNIIDDYAWLAAQRGEQSVVLSDGDAERVVGRVRSQPIGGGGLCLRKVRNGAAEG